MPIAKVNGTNINYKVQGKGEPLVLIMGFTSDQSGWIFQRGAFSKHYSVITFDNRGVGKSDKPSGDYSSKMMADDAIGLMDHLGIKKAHILAVSMGGTIGQQIAINYPERVNKLVLGCTFATTDDSSGITAELTKALQTREKQIADDGKGMNIFQFLDVFLPSTFNKRLYRTVFLPIMKIQARLNGSTGLLGQLAVGFAHNSLDSLHTINVRTLVITGTKDRLIKPTSSEVIAKLIPNAKLVKVEGGSHGFFIEMSGRFNREVLDFLRA